MKKTIGKLKQALSIVLVAAMIVTCLPQAGIPVMAAQDTGVESSDEPEKTDTEENGIMTLGLTPTVRKAEDAENYSVDAGDLTDGKQYFTVTVDPGYMISPEEGAVTATKNGTTAVVEKGEKEDEYYVTVDETDGDVEIVVTVNVVKTFTVTIKIENAADTDGLVKNIMYTTAAAPGDADWKKLETEDAPNLMEILKSGDDFKIKFELKENYKAEVKAGKTGEEKAVTPEDGVYTVENITADTNVIIAAAPIQYTIDTVITVDGKNVTDAEIEEIKKEIKEETGSDLLVTGYEEIESLQKGENLELSLASGDLVYYIESVKCKVGSISEKMTYGVVDDPDEVKYGLTADKIAEVFPELQDGDTITVVINMEKAWKVTFNLEGVTVQDARSTNSDGWYEIIDKGTCYVRKGSSLALTAEMNADTGNDVQLREAWYQTGTEKTDIKDKIDGKRFSITINADTDITITAGAQTYQLSFDNRNKEIIEVSELKLGGRDVPGDSLTLKEGEVTSSNMITFKATPKPGYNKPVVTVEEKRGSGENEEWVKVNTLTPTGTAADVYELTSLAADSRIVITEDGLDEKTCNVLNIMPEVDTNPNAYTAKITVSGKEAGLNSKDTYLAPLGASTAELTIQLRSGYGSLAVKLNGVPLEPKDGKYEITFTDKRAEQNITVSAEEEAAEADTTVRFANTAPHMSYKVVTKDSPVTQVTDGKVSNTYKISKGGSLIRFTVTAANAYYKPEVKVNNVNGDPIVPVSVDSKKRIYTYSIAAKTIINKNNSGIIYIQETSEKRSVSVDYDTDAVKVSADVGGGLQEPEEGAVYSVIDGNTINFKVSVEDNYKLVNITAKNLTTGKETKVTKNSISVKADANYKVTVNTQALPAISVYAVDSDNAGAKVPVPMNKNKSYSVQDGTDYTVEVYNGAVKAELKNAEFTTGIESEAKVEEDGTVTVKINRADAVGIKKVKQLTLKLKDKDKKEYTVTLELLPLAKVKKVDGVKVVKKENVLTQTVNTTKTYAITMEPTTAAVTLGARVKGENTGVTAEVRGRTLVIITNTDTVKEKLATVELYDTTAPEGEGKEPYSFYVTTALPTLPTPTVALQSADDTTLTLTLGAKNLALPDGGEVYYRVAVTPDAKAVAKLTDAQKANVKSVTKYFEVTGADSKGSTSQTAAVKVIDAEFGSGFANTFDVKATLVQSKRGKTIAQVSDETEGNKLAESTTSATKKGLKTKAPAYATKITFKKGASAVYTNQSNVLAATAVFDKNATYTTLMDENSGVGAPEDLSYPGDSDKALKVSIENGNRILVSATSKTAPGKHVIRVTADITGTTNMKLTTADYTVTVERAIEKIELDAPIVYKAAGKAVSFTVGITYNEGTTQPKAKKVNWTITDEDGNELSKEEARGVTVKNGKVTIPKDYIMTEDDGEGMCDYVYVKATAADVTDNLEKAPVVSDPVEIYICNWVESVGETILVKYDNSKNNWKVIARSGETVTAEELKGACIAVLKKGAVDKDIYSPNELFNESVGVDMTYKVNNKAIVLDYDRIEEVNGGGLKNVTITATTADGSNLKSELKNLKVNYYEPKEYGLAVRQITPWEEEDAHVLHQGDLRYDFNGALDTVFELQVMELLGDGWDDCGELSAASNYTLTVANASILEKDVVRGAYTIIGNKADITLKLTDKTKKAPDNVTTYTLCNKAVSTAKAPTLTAVPNSNLIAGTHRGDQQISYKVANFNGDEKETRVLITLDAKDSTNIKNRARYEAFARDCNEFLNNARYTVERLKKRGLVFGTEGNTNIPAGTYKLTVNFGIVADDGGFEAIAKPVSLTVKASAPKISVKLNSDYTLSINDAAAGAVLTLNNKNVVLTSVSVVNDNVNGKENHFTDYFEICDEEDGTFVLRIKNDLGKDELNYIRDTNKAKNDLTGWVTYTYDNGIFETEPVQAQIKVKRYAEPQYTMDSGDVVRGNDMTVDLIARANGNKIPVAFVHTDPLTLKDPRVVEGIWDTVRFTVTGDAKKQNVYFVPATSAYTEVLKELSDAIEKAGNDATKKKEAEAAYVEAVKAYGVMVKVTVNVKPTMPSEGYIAFDNKSKTAAFNRDNYWVDDSSGDDLNHVPDYKGRYNITIPFKKKIVESEPPVAEITAIMEGKIKKTEDYKDLLKADIEYGESVLHFDLLKEKLADLGIYEKKLKVTISVSRPDPNGGEKGKAISEDFTFTLTLPKEAAAAATPQEAIDAVSGDAAKLSAVELEDWQVWTLREIGSVTDNDLKEAQDLRESLYFDNVEEVEKIIEPFNEKRDSDIEFRLGHWKDVDSEAAWEQFVKENIAVDSVVTFPTLEKQGFIKYTVTWENFATAANADDHTGKMVIERKIAKLPVAPGDLEQELNAAISKAQNNEDLTLTDKNRREFGGMLAAEIRKQLFTEANKADRKHLRVSVWECGATPADPENKTLPKVMYSVCLQDVTYGGWIEETATFDQYTDYSEQMKAATLYVEAWIKETNSKIEAGEGPKWLNNDISINDLIERLERGYDERYEDLFGDEDPIPELKIADKTVTDNNVIPDFTVTKAGKGVPGKVDGSIKIEIDAWDGKDTDIVASRDFSFAIPAMKYDISDIVAKTKKDMRYDQIKFTDGSQEECKSNEENLRRIVAPCADVLALGEACTVKTAVPVGTCEITKPATTEAPGEAVIKFTITYGGHEEEVVFEFDIYNKVNKVAHYYCNCGYDTYNYDDLGTHLSENVRNGNPHSYNTVYDEVLQ